MVAARVGRRCYDAASHSIVEFIRFEGVDVCTSLLVVRLSVPPPCGRKLEMALPRCSLEMAPHRAVGGLMWLRLRCGWKLEMALPRCSCNLGSGSASSRLALHHRSFSGFVGCLR